MHRSLTDNFHQHALFASPIEPKVELSIGDRDDDLAAHDLAFEMRVGVVLASSVVLVLADRLVWSQPFKPDFVIVQETAFRIVYEDRRTDVHGVH